VEGRLTLMMLTDLASVARAAGLDVVETPGWETRTRPGGQASVKTIVCHHTAGLHDLRTIIDGRAGLAGPLSHFFLARTGVVYVVAAGKCNHAGVVLKNTYANENAIGIEAEAVGVPGTKGDWPEVQMVAYARLCKALHEHFGLTVLDVRGHKEVCSPPGRKSDPDFNMTAFRERVAHVDLTPVEPDMPLTTADVEKIVAALVPVMHSAVKSEVLSVLTGQTIVSNPPTHPTDPANAPGSVVWALAANYQKTKQQGEQIAAILEAVAPPAPTT
jgi:N-acetyl-anhydromuramyl-L-alanine amidase AmpD